MNVLRVLFRAICHFDQKVLDLLEALCHKQQRFTGKTHYFWLKMLSFGYFCLFSWILNFSFPEESLVGKSKGLFLLLMLLAAGMFGFDWWEKRSYRRLAQGLANPLRTDGLALFVRVSKAYIMTSLFLSGAIACLLVLWLRDAFLLLCIAVVWSGFIAMYVLPACDPLPPVKGKMGEWLSFLFARPAISSS